jgi:drug/metabolite transporter (DMT)-like permease
MSAVFAICSAFLYALSNVITKIGLRYVSTSSGVLISLLFCFVSVLVYCLFSTSLDKYLNRGVLFFLAAGIIGPFWGRVLLYIGIKRVGTAIASTLYEDKPLFSIIAAVIVLGEGLSLSIFFGMFLMMAGTAIVSLEKSGGQIETKWSKKDLIFPLASGACYGVAHALRKMGLNVTPSPLVGVMVQNIGAMVFIPILFLSIIGEENILSNNKSAWLLFGLVGILQVLAQWCLFKALQIGKVVVVSPLSSLSTFFVLFLTAVFLHGLEKVTWRILFGAILILCATLILTLKT